jgi:hypothetical protein
MRMRVVSENQDESKRPLKRRRTRQETLRKPSINRQRQLLAITKVRTTYSAFEEDTSLLKARRKRAKRDRNALPYGSIATQDAARQEKDNNHGKQAKSMRVAREARVFSGVLGIGNTLRLRI